MAGHEVNHAHIHGNLKFKCHLFNCSFIRIKSAIHDYAGQKTGDQDEYDDSTVDVYNTYA